MIIRIARRIEIAGMRPPNADLLGRDPVDPGNFLIVSDLESVFLTFPHQKIPDDPEPFLDAGNTLPSSSCVTVGIPFFSRKEISSRLLCL